MFLFAMLGYILHHNCRHNLMLSPLMDVGWELIVNVMRQLQMYGLVFLVLSWGKTAHFVK